MLEREVENLLEQQLEEMGWIIRVGDSKRNVYRQNPKSLEECKALNGKHPDFVLYENQSSSKPIALIETKKSSYRKVEDALFQVKEYAHSLKVRFVFVFSKNIFISYDTKNNGSIYIDDIKLDKIPSLEILLKLSKIEGNNLVLSSKLKIESREQLISVFDYANNQLRAAGITTGITRFTEFSNLLFLKLISEKNENVKYEIPDFIKWDSYKNLEGEALLTQINEIVIPKLDDIFKSKEKDTIFNKLKITDYIALKKIINKLDQLDLSNIKTDIKGDAFEYFIQKYNSGNNDLGEYFTPRHIVDFLVKIADPEFTEKIYDPFCGTGGILISTFNYVNQKLKSLNMLTEDTLKILRQDSLYGSEISMTAKIAKMNMILTGDGHSNIKQHNTFENPVKSKYDVVITNIPFNQTGTTLEGVYKIDEFNGNSQAIQHIINSLRKKNTSRAFIIVPEGVLNNSELKLTRKHLIDSRLLKGIISLPCGVFYPYTEAKTSILCLKNDCNKDVFFYRVKNDGYTLTQRRRKLEGITDFDEFLALDIMSTNEDNENIQRVSYEKIEKNDNYSLIWFKYDNSVKEGYIKLSDIIQETNIKNSNNAPTITITNSEYFGISTGADYWGDNFVSVTSADNKDYKVIRRNELAYNPSRIRIGSIGINIGNKDLAVSKMYKTFKIVNKEYLPEYIFLLFRKNQDFIMELQDRSFGTVRQTLSFDDLANISIKIIDLKEQQKYVEKFKKLYNNYTSVCESIAEYKID